jgi:uncharacterized membrane protein
MSTDAKNFFTKAEKTTLKRAILNAELDTSGEIRVHIESECKGEALDRATFIFQKLKMHKTSLHNGILFYLAVESKKFAIIGDTGINQAVPDNFWEDTKEIMAGHFTEGRFVQGLSEAISLTGEKLKRHFPHHSDDINELSDEISFS